MNEKFGAIKNEFIIFDFSLAMYEYAAINDSELNCHQCEASVERVTPSVSHTADTD